jgi:hypothetical protein
LEIVPSLIFSTASLDPRPSIKVPAENAPWLPQMEALAEVLGRSRALHPPMRDIDGDIMQAREFQVPGLHGFTQNDANAEQTSEQYEHTI